MSEQTGTTDLSGILSPFRARQRRLNAMRWACHGLLIGAACGCVAGAATRLASDAEPLSIVLIGAVSTLTAAAIAAALGLTRPVHDLAIARAIDRAASSDDRFASAVQLAGHHRRQRVGMIVDDAAARVAGTRVHSALPARLPRTLRWVPLPIALLALVLVAMPGSRAQAGVPREPEISASDWKEIEQSFKKDLQKLNRPLTPQEQAIRHELEKLAAMLAEKPEKKEALTEIARLSDKIAQQRKALGAKPMSLKNAASAVKASKMLQQFASSLKEGDYDKAAADLEKLSERLKNEKEAPDAEEMEAMAADLQRLAEQMKQDKEMQEECKNCSGSAGKMNPKELAEALKRLSQQMKKNAQSQSQCDNLGDAESLLEQLKRMMNQCEGGGDKEGNGPPKQARKGGHKAGWGTSAKWDGGTMKPGAEKPVAELAAVQEHAGAQTTFKTVSPDERAASSKSYKELYAEFVQKSEADLDLDSVPAAYRDYLRRYFKAIRPADNAVPDSESKTP